MVGLDVTHQCLMTAGQIEGMAGRGRHGTFLRDITQFYLGYHRRAGRLPSGMPKALRLLLNVCWLWARPSSPDANACRQRCLRETEKLYCRVYRFPHHLSMPLPVPYCRKVYGMEAVYVHDAAALAAVLDPTLFDWHAGGVLVVTDGPAKGHTIRDEGGRGGWDLDCAVVLIICCGVCGVCNHVGGRGVDVHERGAGRSK